jgi:chromodomain-helicase-DNA-binding protein 1
MGEVRFSTRRAAKVATYNEEEDYGLSDEDTEMTPNGYYYEQEDLGPAIDVVLNHRLKDGAGM